MAIDPTRRSDPADVSPAEPPAPANSEPSVESADPAAVAASRELSEEVPVPIAMWPSEIDERARVVEALEEETELGARPPQPPRGGASPDDDLLGA